LEKTGSLLQQQEGKQQPKYHREGETQTVNTELGGIKFVQSVRENGTGSAIVDIRSIAQKIQ